jgi:hypothetical protein
LKNNLTKALTWEWVTVHKKDGKTYERRQRKKIKITEHTPENTKSQRTEEWNKSSLSAGLKDKLVNSLKYNGNYYDTWGNPIFIPERFKDIIEENDHTKKNASTFVKFLTGAKDDLEKEKKQKLIDSIKEKDKLYNEALEIEKEKYNKYENAKTIKTNINSYLGAVNEKRSSINDLLFALNYARKAIDADIDPTIQIKFKDKTQDKPLSEIIERLQKAKIEQPDSKNTSIQSVGINNLDDYEDDDFIKQPFEVHVGIHKNILKYIDKKLKKALDDELFYKSLEHELGEDVRNCFDDDSFNIITKAMSFDRYKTSKAHLIKK